MDYKEQFQKICEKANLVGANNVIVKNDEIKERCFYGYSDLETKTKTNEKTIYRIASISKTILSIALIILLTLFISILLFSSRIILCSLFWNDS